MSDTDNSEPRKLKKVFYVDLGKMDTKEIPYLMSKLKDYPTKHKADMAEARMSQEDYERDMCRYFDLDE